MVLPYHYKSFSLRLFLSVALLNILGILVINSATYNDTAVIGRQAKMPAQQRCAGMRCSSCSVFLTGQRHSASA